MAALTYKKLSFYQEWVFFTVLTEEIGCWLSCLVIHGMKKV